MELVEEGYITLEASNARKAIKPLEHSNYFKLSLKLIVLSHV
jgi:hypothetical protein